MVIIGKYKLTSSENYDEYLKEIGVDFMARKLFTAEIPTVEIKQYGYEYIITTATALKTMEMKFKLGEEFEESTWDGRNCKSVITQENGNKLVQTQIYQQKISNVVRDFHGDKMTMTLVANNVISTRIYTQVKEGAN